MHHGANWTKRRSDLATIRRVVLVVLGMILIVVFAFVWKYVTGAMTLFLEDLWCTTIDQAGVCRYRGYQHFLLWSVVGIVNLVVLGVLWERIANRSRR